MPNKPTIESTTVLRDEVGRPIAPDGYPISGLATVTEVVVASGLCPSTVYNMIKTDKLKSQKFGRSVRVPWQVLREMKIIGTQPVE